MKRHGLYLIMVFSRLCLINGFGQASDPNTDPNRDVRFEQYLGQSVSPDIRFTDESGQPVTFENYLHRRPVILGLGYYQCPMLCGVVLNALVQGLQDLPPTLAKRDFNFLFVSIDPAESSSLAKDKLQNYLKRYGWAPAAERWHFLTGSPEEITQLATLVGFRYRYDSVAKQFAHPSGLIVLTPEGKISSYLLGIEYPARTIDEALSIARKGEVARDAPVSILLCFSQNVTPGSVAFIVLVALRVAAVLTLLGLAFVIYRAGHRPRKKVVT